MGYFSNLLVARFVTSIKNSNKQDLQNVISESSNASFKGMLPFINSAILQSDRFHGFQHKNVILVGITMVNNIIFSSLLAFILGKFICLICGKFVGVIVDKVTYPLIIGIVSLFFFASLVYHRFLEKKESRIQRSIEEESNEQTKDKLPLHSAISDVSIIHTIGLLFIPCLFGTIADYLVSKGRKFFSYAENEFSLEASDAFPTKISDILITQKSSSNETETQK